MDLVGAGLSESKREIERTRTRRLLSVTQSSGESETDRSSSSSASSSSASDSERSESDSSEENAGEEDSEWQKVKMPCAECQYQANAVVWAQVRVSVRRFVPAIVCA